MDFEKIKKTVNQLSEIEERYPVELWRFNGIQYWPILKNIIYFRNRRMTKTSLFKKMLNEPITTLRKVTVRLIEKGYNGFLKSKIPVDLTEIPKCDIIFSGSKAHLQYMGGYWLNRYFDPIIDNIEGHYSSILFDYSLISPQNIYKKERVINLFDIYTKESKKVHLKITLDPRFVAEIKQVSEIIQISESVLAKELLDQIKKIIIWKSIWDNILSKTEAKVVFSLCYYNEPMYGLMLAAKERGIPSVDMQHGGQGELHPAYYFKKFPESGFNTLPSIFWVWSKSSENHILKWLTSVNHNVVVGGNPWIDFLRNSRDITINNNNKKVIVCTLTIGLTSILPDYLLNSIIESSDEYIWSLRFHPRTSTVDKRSLDKILKKHKIYKKVEIKRSNELPLPILLLNAWAHISHSSGSLSEAAILGIQRNIVTSEIGAENHIELLQEAKVFYYNPDTEIKKLIEFAENLDLSSFKNKEDESKFENYNLKIDEIINNSK